MNILTLKLPGTLDHALVEASARENLSKSEYVRRALEAYLKSRSTALSTASVLDQVQDLVGCCEGGPEDLASNPQHLSGFGQR